GYFSAGLDLKLMPTLAPDALRRMLLAFGRTMLRVFTFPIPTVAAVSGHAIAGGAMLAFACDLRWAADGPFRLHLNEVAIGLPLPTWAIVIAASAVPHRWHTEAILHARAYLPPDAVERNLVNGVVAPDRLLDESSSAAARLGALHQAAYAASKTRLRAMAVEWALARLEPEVMSRPPRS
ncbi:MAG: enoyl-CoA hydratase, partial [Deltaproteobacteria bacterium]